MGSCARLMILFRQPTHIVDANDVDGNTYRNRTMERIAVSASYEAVKLGKAVTGRVDFIARVADPTKGYDLTSRAQSAVVRRL